jgi:hypothetical protein
MDIKQLCIDIATKENGKEVINILKNKGLWDDEKYWKPVGNHKGLNNHSIIGNQQSNPANALVEKLVNSGDSALMLKCLESKIDPKSLDAPKNLKEAVSTFFNVRDGRWIELDKAKKSRLAEKYCNLIVTGEKGAGANPSYTIIDSAEGQEPEDFKKTFLSLTQKNKSDISFVQGKFGMGSYGAVNFCKVDGLELILSKRNPSITKKSSKNLWGFTIIRKIEPTQQQRLPEWFYLAIDDQIPQFEADYLDLMPGVYPSPYGFKFEHGSFVKLYNYDIGPSLRSNITLDLYNKLNTLLVNPVVPIKLYERRVGFNAHSNESILDGLETRLDRDRSDILANGFPSEFIFNVENQRIKGKVYAFKKYLNEDKKTLIDTKKYGNGVLFCMNGQSNGSLPPSFFSAGELKYENISKNLLVIMDCSELDPNYVFQLFQNDRERIFDNAFSKKIKEQIIQELSDHSGLKQFQNEWRGNEVRLQSNKNSVELFNMLLKKNKPLASFLFGGNRIGNLFGEKNVIPEFDSKYYPSFFKLVKPALELQPRDIEETRNAKINLITDAPNDYFTRPLDPGSIKVFLDDKDITDLDGIKLSGFNGKWILSLPSSNVLIQKYQIVINDDSRVSPFEETFYLKLIDKKEHTKPPHRKPKDMKDLPNLIKIGKDDFESYGIDKYDVLKVVESTEGFDYYLNIDNVHMQAYLKDSKNDQIDEAKNQYELAMAVIGLVLIQDFKKQKGELSLGEFTKEYTRRISPLILPLVRDIATV